MNRQISRGSGFVSAVVIVFAIAPSCGIDPAARRLDAARSAYSALLSSDGTQSNSAIAKSVDALTEKMSRSELKYLSNLEPSRLSGHAIVADPIIRKGLLALPTLGDLFPVATGAMFGTGLALAEPSTDCRTVDQALQNGVEDMVKIDELNAKVGKICASLSPSLDVRVGCVAGQLLLLRAHFKSLEGLLTKALSSAACLPDELCQPTACESKQPLGADDSWPKGANVCALKIDDEWLSYGGNSGDGGSQATTKDAGVVSKDAGGDGQIDGGSDIDINGTYASQEGPVGINTACKEKPRDSCFCNVDGASCGDGIYRKTTVTVSGTFSLPVITYTQCSGYFSVTNVARSGNVVHGKVSNGSGFSSGGDFTAAFTSTGVTGHYNSGNTCGTGGADFSVSKR